MNESPDLELQLREALRETSAPPLLRARILNAAASRGRRSSHAVLWRRIVALAALLTIGSFGLYRWEQRRRAEAVAEQFKLALRIAHREVVEVQANLVVEVPVQLPQTN
ncbi:MAG: hypothetical protein ACK532_03205 [Acidobacteriota bacterium]|jgi:hypothetical protein